MDLGSQSGMVVNNKPPRRTGSKILTFILFLLIVGAAVGLGYLYWQEMDKSAKLQAQVNDKQAALDKAKSNADEAPAAANAEYTAEVGKFKLTLDKNYFIIVSLDGPFEGGPATSLSVGTKNDKGTQTVAMPAGEGVTINAKPLDGTYADAVKNSLNQEGAPAPKKLSSIKVDGVDAEVFQSEGLYIGKVLFFHKNNIFYEIEAPSAVDNPEAQKKLDDVIKGFKFQS